MLSIRVRDIVKDAWHFMLEQPRLYLFLVAILFIDVLLSFSLYFTFVSHFSLIGILVGVFFRQFFSFSLTSFVLQNIHHDTAKIDTSFRIGFSKVIQYAGVVLWLSMFNIVHLNPSSYNMIIVLFFALFAIAGFVQAVLNFFLIPMLVDKDFTTVHLFQKSLRYVMTYWWLILKLVLFSVVFALCVFWLSAFFLFLITLFLKIPFNLKVLNFSMQIFQIAMSIFILISRVFLYRAVSKEQ
jgi:hypothetical protein